MQHRLPVLAAALWWGSLSVIGPMVVPLLFARLPQVALAGYMAAHLFAAQTWVSIACCACLLLVSRQKHAHAMEPWARGALTWVILGMLLAMLLQFGVAPRILTRQDLRLWHTLGAAMYMAQWLCALVVLWRLSGHGATGRPAGS